MIVALGQVLYAPLQAEQKEKGALSERDNFTFAYQVRRVIVRVKPLFHLFHQFTNIEISIKKIIKYFFVYIIYS